MRIHREGKASIILASLLAAAVIVLCVLFNSWPFYLLALGGIVLLVLILQFFRNPERHLPDGVDNIIYAPADGRVVVIEHLESAEYFDDQRIQVSIFMSPLNVHVNRIPVSGIAESVDYYPGKYLVAWHPKSSELNERSTVVIKTSNERVLVRQIAGAVARRIVTYPKPGETVKKGDELGFIKFGSRCDLILPHNSELLVQLNDNVFGNRTPIARVPGL